MSDVRVRTRKPVSRRRERVGGMSPVATPKLVLGESPGPRITVPEQFPYRAALANWPDEWRETWGRRANALEEGGLDWRDAEVRAFVELLGSRRAAVEAGSAP